VRRPAGGRAGDRKRLSEYVAEQILSAIDAGIHRPGDRLPPERALAEQLQVSRNSVREALRALELSGIVEAQVGSGTFVKRLPSDSIDFHGALEAVDVGFDAIELWEAQCELEIVIIGIAADRATSRDFEALSTIRGRMAAAAQASNVQEFLDLSWEFRCALARACGNGPLHAAQTVLHRLKEKGIARKIAREALGRRLDASAAAHAAMLLAVRLRDRDAAAQAVRAHYEILRQHLAEQLLAARDETGMPCGGERDR
jgi:GntR family transcriptional repressor for pyruvate dehydrogenase complex